MATQKIYSGRLLRRRTRRRMRRRTKQAAHVHVRQGKLRTYEIPKARATLLREAPASLEAPFTAVLKDIVERHVDFLAEKQRFLRTCASVCSARRFQRSWSLSQKCCSRLGNLICCKFSWSYMYVRGLLRPPSPPSPRPPPEYPA